MWRILVGIIILKFFKNNFAKPNKEKRDDTKDKDNIKNRWEKKKQNWGKKRKEKEYEEKEQRIFNIL